MQQPMQPPQYTMQQPQQTQYHLQQPQYHMQQPMQQLPQQATMSDMFNMITNMMQNMHRTCTRVLSSKGWTQPLPALLRVGVSSAF